VIYSPGHAYDREDQAKHHAASEPTGQFVSLVTACLSSGRAHLASPSGGMPAVSPNVASPNACGWREKPLGDRMEWCPSGDCVGWLENEQIYLQPEATYRTVQDMARTMGESFCITLPTLKKRLHEKGLIASRDENRQVFTTRKTLGGSRKDTLHIVFNAIFPDPDF
jgi:hypothetical protein